jgi:hypothetical protein
LPRNVRRYLRESSKFHYFNNSKIEWEPFASYLTFFTRPESMGGTITTTDVNLKKNVDLFKHQLLNLNDKRKKFPSQNQN